MPSSIPSIIEDLAVIDNTEDTHSMIRDLGLALLDDSDDFVRDVIDLSLGGKAANTKA